MPFSQVLLDRLGGGPTFVGNSTVFGPDHKSVLLRGRGKKVGCKQMAETNRPSSPSLCERQQGLCQL